jgi:hypothetical protein
VEQSALANVHCWCLLQAALSSLPSQTHLLVQLKLSAIAVSHHQVAVAAV